MLSVNNISVIFPDKKLFDDVNLIFNDGNWYGVIGATAQVNLSSLRFYLEKKNQPPEMFPWKRIRECQS